MPALELTEHRVPTGGILVEPALCGNCTRRLYTEHGGLVLCPDCSQVADAGAQIWMCTECETVRVWGWGRPLEGETRNKWLGCSRCNEVTLHDFAKVSTGRSS